MTRISRGVNHACKTDSRRSMLGTLYPALLKLEQEGYIASA